MCSGPHRLKGNNMGSDTEPGTLSSSAQMKHRHAWWPMRFCSDAPILAPPSRNEKNERNERLGLSEPLHPFFTHRRGLHRSDLHGALAGDDHRCGVQVAGKAAHYSAPPAMSQAETGVCRGLPAAAIRKLDPAMRKGGLSARAAKRAARNQPTARRNHRQGPS